MRFWGVIDAEVRERTVLVYLPDLDGVAVTGLTGSDFAFSLYYQADGTSGFVDVTVLGVTVAEVDATNAPGWYTLTTTPYGAGETVLTAAPSFANNTGPFGVHIDSRPAIGAEPSKYLVVEDEEVQYLIPAFARAIP